MRRCIYAAVPFMILAAIPLGLPFYDDWKIERDLAAAVAEADQVDPGWRSMELQKALDSVPDAENAALPILSLGKQFPRGYDAKFRDLPLPAGMEAGSHDHWSWTSDIQYSLGELPEVNVLNEQQIIAVNSEWKEHRTAFEKARALTAYRACLFPFRTVDDRIAANSSTRVALSLLEFDNHRLLQEKNMTGALDCMEAMLALADFAQAHPDSSSPLIRGATIEIAGRGMGRVLGQGEPDGARLADIQTLLHKAEQVPALLQYARPTRAEVWQQLQELLAASPEKLKEWQEMMRGFDKAFEEKKKEEPHWILAWLAKDRKHEPRIWIARELRAANAWVEFAKLPVNDQYRGFDEFTKKQREVKTMSATSYERVAAMQWRILMRMRTTRAAIALERYRQAKGDWPKTLDQLVPDFLADVPMDVYSAKPLMYHGVDRGAVVYSVGMDEKDNGGRFRPDKNEVTGLRMEGLDIGVRLWDPAHRRQPPLPPVPPPLRDEM
jgi:hypothetical protein